MNIDVTYFRGSALIPPGVAVVLKGDAVVYFGSLFALTDEMQNNRIPAESIIHLNLKDYRTISKRMQQIVPEAPSVEAQNREFEGQHTHPKYGKTISVFKMDISGDHWMWCASGCPVTDQTRYPTAEGAYRAAIGD